MTETLQKSKSFLKAFLDIVLPPSCYVCGENCDSKYGLCEQCLEKIKHILPPSCQKCGKPLGKNESTCGHCGLGNSYIEKNWSCCYYEGTVRECVHLFKYKGYMGLVDIFGDIMAAFLKKNRIDKEVDLIVPVPVYPTKKRERTYNHSEVLASFLSKRSSIPLDSKNLKKISWTQSQSELDREKRLRNVKDSFITVDKKTFFGKNVLLVDDVYTTGATIDECAKTLLAANAGKVFSFTLARGA